MNKEHPSQEETYPRESAALLISAHAEPPSPAPPMTLANMRANGVRTLAAWCLGRGCEHRRLFGLAWS